MAWRIAFFGDEIEEIVEFDPLTGKKIASLDYREGLRQFALCDARPDAEAGDGGDPLRADRAAEGAAGAKGELLEAQRLEQRTNFDLEMIAATGSLRRHRELQPLPHRPPARRAAADPVRISARQRPAVRRREPPDGAAGRRDGARRPSPQADARRIWLPPAELHRQPAAALQRMGRDAPADGRGLGDARALGDGADRRRLRRAGDPPDRPDRPAGRDQAGRGPGRRSDRRGEGDRRARAIARSSPR